MPALALSAVGIAYLLTLGRWLTPRRAAVSDLVDVYDLRDYLSVLHVEAGSPLTDRSLGELRFYSEYGLLVVGIERQGRKLLAVDSGTTIRGDDFLLVEGKIKDIAAIEERAGVTISRPTEDLALPDERSGPGRRNEAAEFQLAELLVPPRSPLVGRSIRQLDFRHRFRLPVLGIQRHGASLVDHVQDVVLAPGDLLLVEGTAEDLRAAHGSNDLALLGAVDLPARRVRKLPVAVGIMAAVVLLAAFGVMPIIVSALLGMIAMFVTGCVTPEEAYKEVDWMVLVLLGSIISLGIALQKTGAAELLAERALALTMPLGLHGVLAVFFLLTSVLTSVLSNNAAAVVLTPIAIATAAGLDVSPLPFIIAVMIAASNSYATPIGYQTNTFILGPGGYHFSDFFRVGAPLNLLMVAAATLVIPIFFPFHP